MTLDIEYRDASYRSSPYGGGKLIRRTEARFGSIRAEGATRTEAKAALLEAVTAQCEHAYVRRYLTGIAAHDGRSVTFVLYYAAGWVYDIVRAGAVSCSSSHMGAISETEAIARMREHFDQYTEVISEG